MTTHRTRLFTHNLAYVLSMIALVVLLFARLGHVQLIEGSRFQDQADDNRFFTVAVPPTRGVFLDRYGQPLQLNVRNYYRKTEPFSLYSPLEPLTHSQGLALMATDAARLATKDTRLYPYGEALAHVLGYVGPVTSEELEEDDSYLPTELVGKIGLEAEMNDQLRGVPGSETWEINAQVARQRIISQKPPRNGSSIETTLDPYLSKVAYDALGEKRGSVVIVDADDGQVLALVNKPSFDPNLFAQQTEDETLLEERRDRILSLFADENKPFFDRAVSGSYPPGSVFKLVTALAGLESEAFTTATTVIDEGVLRVGEYEYGNWYYRQYGRTEGEIGLVRSIARSNDIFFYKAAEWIGVDRLAAMSRQFGLGTQTGIEVGPEAEGLVPDPAWKERVIGEPWYLGNTYHFGIGQGDLLVSPVQVVQLVQAIANNGLQCTPHILPSSDSESCRLLGLREENIAVVIEGMLDACSPNGTAFPFFERNGRIREQTNSQEEALQEGAVACKTGTAEFGPADQQGYRDTHGWWVGFVEPQVELTLSSEDPEQEQTASVSAELEREEIRSATTSAQLHQEWKQTVEAARFPERLVITVLVESDDQEKFREGSGDAAPVGKAIIDWLEQ